MSEPLDSLAGRTHAYASEYQLTAPQLTFIAAPAVPFDAAIGYQVTIAAFGDFDDGIVEIAGSQGVRISAGPPGLPPVHDATVDGVTVAVGDAETIKLERGMIAGVDQRINMLPALVQIDGGAGQIVLEADVSITLKVAGGIASITLTAEGIILSGPIVEVSGEETVMITAAAVEIN